MCRGDGADDDTAYFLVEEPKASTQWKNGEAAPVKWDKGVLDGVDAFDLEMARLSSDGLTYIAMNGASTAHELPIAG